MCTTHETKELNRFLMELVSTLVAVVEQKDPFLKGHSERVANMCVAFSRRLEQPEKACSDKIYFAGLLHDIGMVYMPTALVQKPGPLSHDETIVMRQHPVISEKILSHLSIVREILPIIRHHHEAFDGSGYPDGLRGEEIPLGARVLSLVDSFDAMVSPRAHREAMSSQQATEEILRIAGKRYDSRLAALFVAFVKGAETGDKGRVGSSSPAAGRSVQEIIVEIVQRFKKGSIELPVLPNVVQEIDRVIEKPTSTIEDLIRVVEKDAVISLRLIAVANSPVYRGIEEIRTLRQAIPRLGVKETRSVVTTIVSRSLYKTRDPKFKSLMEKLWLHALACAYGARQLARLLDIPDPDKLFLMGLVHDIGKVLLVKTLSEVVSMKNGMKTEDVVTSIQQMHCSFGAALLRRWGFGNDFVRIVTLHEGPEFSEGVERDILAVHIANRITRSIGFSLFAEAEDEEESSAAQMLGLDAETIEKVGAQTRKLMAEAAGIF